MGPQNFLQEVHNSLQKRFHVKSPSESIARNRARTYVFEEAAVFGQTRNRIEKIEKMEKMEKMEKTEETEKMEKMEMMEMMEMMMMEKEKEKEEEGHLH